jgi:hypothetical protein
VILAYDLGQLPGPQTVCQRTRRLLLEPRRLEEVCHEMIISGKHRIAIARTHWLGRKPAKREPAQCS